MRVMWASIKIVGCTVLFFVAVVGQTLVPQINEDAVALKAAAEDWLSKAVTVMDPLLPFRDLQRGVVHFGSRERMRRAAIKLLRGEKLTIAAVGGSITAGQGVADGGYPWPTWMARWINATKPDAQFVVHNGAVGGTRSSYMSMCLKVHVPEDADIVLLEYAINDLSHPTPVFNNGDRIAMELLIRKVLQLKNKPAVVMMNAYQWFTNTSAEELPGRYWSNSEAEYLDFATYYGLSMLSVKAAAYHKMVAGDWGFKVDRPRSGPDWPGTSPRGEHFYWDVIHPDGNTGARVMGELGFMLITDAIHSIARNSPSSHEHAPPAASLPRPIIHNNYESVHDACWIGPKFKDMAVKSAQGFEWINEAPSSRRPKWGYVATTVSSQLELQVPTKTNDNMPMDTEVVVGISYLRSYEHMGTAGVTCVSGCTCEASQFNGHHTEHNSQMYTHSFKVTQAQECVMRVTVLEASDSGEHKVKVMGVVVSEKSDGSISLGTAALEYVHDISFRGNGSFEIHNHA